MRRGKTLYAEREDGAVWVAFRTHPWPLALRPSWGKRVTTGLAGGKEMRILAHLIRGATRMH